jgi:imidazolonepropionase-like amidohydrolase
MRRSSFFTTIGLVAVLAFVQQSGLRGPLIAGVASAPILTRQSPGLDTVGATLGRTFAVVNGRLFDGTGGGVVDDAVVLVENNRITAVGPADDVEIPRGAERIDAQGGTVMPGVIDSHVHLFPTLTHRFARGQDIVTPWIEAGVTTMVDTGSVRHMTRASRALVEAVPHPPRLFMAGPILTVPDGYPTTRREADAAMIAWEVDGPEDAYATVVRLIEIEGVDLIKVAIETGFQTDYRDEGWPTLSPEELGAIARAAHERGVQVRAHVSNPGELEAALDAGLDALAHTPIHPVPDDLLRRAVEAGLIFTSTANIWGANGAATAASTARRVHEMGGTVAIGTDHPYQRGSEMPVAEMELLPSCWSRRPATAPARSDWKPTSARSKQASWPTSSLWPAGRTRTSRRCTTCAWSCATGKS